MNNKMYTPKFYRLGIDDQGEISDEFIAMSKIATFSPLLSNLSSLIAKDKEICEIASFCKSNQHRPYLFFFAIQYLMLSLPGESLQQHLQRQENDPRSYEHIYPIFRRFCLKHADAIKSLISNRTNQATLPDRAALLLPALSFLGKKIKEPLNLIEIGCSAGFLLLFDKYSYDFGNGESLGDLTGPLVLRPEIKGPPPKLPTKMPTIGKRFGIDLNPLDPNNSDDRRWMESIFPIDYPMNELRQRFSAAIELRRNHDLNLFQGDALQVLPELAAQIDGPLCIFHSICLYQWPETALDSLEKTLRQLSLTRTVHRISMEMTDLPEQGYPAEICYLSYEGGEQVSGQILGYGKDDGTWLQWTI